MPLRTSRTTFTFKVFNELLRPLLRSRRDPDAAWDKAVAKAEQISGLRTNAEDEAWIEDFRFLIHCVASVQGLSPIGWFTTIMDARARLINRLRIRNLHRVHPRIADEPIEAPIFIVGLPRTATTLAHKILAASPTCRGPLLWEMVYTDVERDPVTTEKYIAAVRRQFDSTRYAPDFEVIHPVDAERPEESMFLLPHGLYHLLFHAPMPDYQDWFANRDTTADYQYLKQALQVLQYGREPRRWVLKYPMDLGQMNVIQRVFPGATFVWMHRSPVTVMGSLCSLADLAQSLFVSRPDRDAIGVLALDLMTQIVETGRVFRQHHRSSVIDVPYHRLAANPGVYVPELYDQLNLPWTWDDGERLVEVLHHPTRDRKHEYSIKDYGLTVEQIEQAFADYDRMVNSLHS